MSVATAEGWLVMAASRTRVNHRWRDGDASPETFCTRCGLVRRLAKPKTGACPRVYVFIRPENPDEIRVTTPTCALP